MTINECECNNERFMRRPEVMQLTSLASSTLSYLMNKGDFPKPYKLSAKASAWKYSEVMVWIKSRQLVDN